MWSQSQSRCISLDIFIDCVLFELKLYTLKWKNTVAQDCVWCFLSYLRKYIYMKKICWKIFIGNFNRPHLNSRWSSVVSRPHGWKTPEIQMWFGVFSELFHFKMEERSDQVETNSSTLNSNGNNFLIIKISPFFKTMKSVLSRMLLFLFFFFLNPRVKVNTVTKYDCE